MTPGPGERLLRFVGDHIRFKISAATVPAGTRALLRTNLGRAAALRKEIIAAHSRGAAHAGESWRDLPMQKTTDGWEIELPLAEVGFFKSKPYLLDARGWQHWPDGPDAGVSVHPNFARTANTIYCAFTRLFGATKNLAASTDEKRDAQLKTLEAAGYATLPPSGKFRDLLCQLPHIVNQLGCRILHLLPIHPTPTSFARFGRFGSPYAALDLTAVDPALVEFDRRTTGIDQFCELTFAAHSLGARVFIDIVINHTGWGATLQENHPEFFLRNPDGSFASPGAWGTVWEDLVELEQHDVALWDLIADALLVWCRRGVDGFRCDAGYKIPVPAWQYIIARVQDEFPETIFLLEGLGGAWETTESLLTDGGMQWAYSELFQNYSGGQVAWYLDYANRQNTRLGTYVNYSETHDNDRLAKKGRVWSLLRNRLCALTSSSGGYGFTCGVEWLATEQIRVHGCTGLNWNSADNIVPELARLNQLIADHPCFFDGAKLTRLSASDSPVYALLRESAEGRDTVLVLVNTDAEKENVLTLEQPAIGDWQLVSAAPGAVFDLLGQPLPKTVAAKEQVVFTLAPGACFCLAPTAAPVGLSGDAYRRARAQAAFALESLAKLIPAETVDGLNWRWLAEQIENSPARFLVAISEFAIAMNPPSQHPRVTQSKPPSAPVGVISPWGEGWGERKTAGQTRLVELLSTAQQQNIFPRVVTWTLLDTRRITLVPPGHWLLIEDSQPFRATLHFHSGPEPAARLHVQSIPAGTVHVACFAPRGTAGDSDALPADAELCLERHAATSQKVSAAIRHLAAGPLTAAPKPQATDLVLLTNNRGGMARLCVDLGRVNSKYDCVLGANLDPAVPVDRHVFIKRVRAWVNADGFLSPLNFTNLASFTPGSPAVWQFVANAGDGRTVEIELRAEMLPDLNTVELQFRRPTEQGAHGKQLPASADVRITVRCDIEDRNFHSETKRNGGADYHFSSNSRPVQNGVGFEFTPASDRQLHVFADCGVYHPQPEWCENIPHPVEQSRGQTGSGDAYSPGWFELPLAKGATAILTATAELECRAPSRLESEVCRELAGTVPGAPFATLLLHAAKQFVVRRDAGKTVIAGYPWFLDWGRDSLICARGLLAAGMREEVKQLLLTFAKFEKNGTLPNTIHGNDVSNRDTTDAPLWFAVVCEDLHDEKFFDVVADSSGRTIRAVLTSIAGNYARGTPNGIRMDPGSALIWSPSHFTWMDTNYPAGTPREGYPVEIQVLWIHLLRLLEKIGDAADREKWRDLAAQATTSLEQLYWREDKGWFADVLLAGPQVAARDAKCDDALRSNCLFAVSLGLVTGDRAKRCVAAAQKYLVVPGALRSLAPLPVSVPLAIYSGDGRLLNDPPNPYWPGYAGDEDTRRKPAYHNGTAWTWTFPVFCEALATAWDFAPEAVAAARSYLGSSEAILNTGCLGQIPEVLDGDAPHTQRGCDAQAWGVTEAVRVWKLLNSPSTQAK